MSAAGLGRYILYSPEGCGKSSGKKHELCCEIVSGWNEVASFVCVHRLICMTIVQSFVVSVMDKMVHDVVDMIDFTLFI